MPKSWSVLATKIAVSKYFYGDIAQGTDPTNNGRETSVRQLVHRVTRTITDWGQKDGYFKTKADAEVFYNDLTWLCVNQHGAFNSPVWFNVGSLSPVRRRRGQRQGQLFFQPHRPARPSARPRSTNIRRAAPASSRPSTTTWNRSWTSPAPRRCSSSSAQGPAPISPPSAPPARR